MAALALVAAAVLPPLAAVLPPLAALLGALFFPALELGLGLGFD